MRLGGRVAVVTGAASGIGHALALALAGRGCALALVDRDADGLARTLDLARERGARASAHALDVTAHEAVAALPAAVLAAHGRVDLLVNNAGVALAGTFEQVSEEDFDWVLAVNFAAPVRLTRAFLPHLRASDDARLVNVSSLFGLVAPPGQAAYAASKFALRAFSEALRHELAGSSVGVTVVHPGGVATAIVERARVGAGVSGRERALHQRQARRLLTMPPERAAAIVVRAVERRRARVIVGRDARLVALCERLLPVSHWDLLAPLLPR
jgi:short-subunit dehydrogenase